jgi:hypothetical protein
MIEILCPEELTVPNIWLSLVLKFICFYAKHSRIYLGKVLVNKLFYSYCLSLGYGQTAHMLLRG